MIAKILFSWHVLKNSILVSGTAANQVPKFRTIDIKLHVLVVTLSTQDNIKSLKQLESSFKRTVNLNKYHSKKNKFKTDI